jgi:hypothetical protein
MSLETHEELDTMKHGKASLMLVRNDGKVVRVELLVDQNSFMDFQGRGWEGNLLPQESEAEWAGFESARGGWAGRKPPVLHLTAALLLAARPSELMRWKFGEFGPYGEGGFPPAGEEEWTPEAADAANDWPRGGITFSAMEWAYQMDRGTSNSAPTGEAEMADGDGADLTCPVCDLCMTYGGLALCAHFLTKLHWCSANPCDP